MKVLCRIADSGTCRLTVPLVQRKKLQLGMNIINGTLMPVPVQHQGDVDAGLSKAERMVARSYATAAVVERVSHGYAEYGTNRTFEHAYQVRCRDVVLLNERLSHARKHVWRPLLRKSIRQTSIRALAFFMPIAGTLAIVTGDPAMAAVLGALSVLGYAWHRPSLSIPHPRVTLQEVFDTRPVARAIKRHHRKMNASALSDPVIAQHLDPLWMGLQEPHREMVIALQPGFPGSVSELLAISADLSEHRS